jgi:hypothetical protein
MNEDTNARAGFPPEDTKEAVEMLSTLRWLYEEEAPVAGEPADDALDTAAYLMWRSGLLDVPITRASKLH